MSELSLPALKRQLVAYSRRLWDRGYVANHDGNVSVRMPARRFLCTPTSFSKGEVGESDLLIVDPDGKRLEGRWKPFGELGLHLAAMRARADVNVVIHAHPPYSTAFACAGRALDCAIIAEAVVSLGDRVPLAKTPPAPGGRVSSIPGERRANRRAVTMRSVLVRTMFIALPIRE
jgi:L-fuculose-phosphate aldolase